MPSRISLPTLTTSISATRNSAPPDWCDPGEYFGGRAFAGRNIAGVWMRVSTHFSGRVFGGRSIARVRTRVLGAHFGGRAFGGRSIARVWTRVLGAHFRGRVFACGSIAGAWKRGRRSSLTLCAFAASLLAAVACMGMAGAAWAQGSHNVELLGHLDLHDQYKDIWGYHGPDGTEVAIIGTSTGTQFVDVTDPTNPTEVLFLPGTISGWREIRTYQSYAYIVNDNRSNEALQIVDLTDPRNPTKVYGGSEFFRKAHTIFVDGSMLYACGSDSAQGYVALDLTDPVAPRFAGSFDGFYMHDVFVREGVAYGAQIYNPGFLGILDVSDPAEPIVIDEIRYPDAMTHNAWLTDDSRFCVTSDEIPGGHVRIWNVEDLRNVHQISEWKHPEDVDSSVHNVFVLGSRVYCSWYTAGLEVLDISRPEFPQRIASYDTYPVEAPPTFEGAWGVYPYLPSGNVLVSDISTGLYILRVDPVLGTARLRVSDASSGDPIVAEIAFPDETLDPGLRARTDAAGELDLFLTPGPQRAIVTAFGFESAEVDLDVVRDQETVVSIELAPLPSGSLSGLIRSSQESGEGPPLAGVRVAVLETPIETRSNESGLFELPAIPAGEWIVELRRFGFRTEPIPIEIVAGKLEDRVFELVSSYWADDCETERGWMFGAPEDNATSGIWVRDDPIGTAGGSVAPEDDASEVGRFAFVTGNGGGDIGTDDVDGGQTTLLSPGFDLSEVFRPWLEFQLWYESSDDLDPNSDIFTVDASSDGGLTWTNVMRTADNTSGWSERRIAIGRFIQITTDVRFRFIARDSGIGSLVEVGVDDVQIYPGREGEPYYEELPGGTPLAFDPPFPNPFLDQVRVQFNLGEADDIGFEIFDAAGRRIRRMSTVQAARGPGHLIWDGLDDSQHRVPSGTYWMVVRTSRGEESMRVVRIR